jgi:hypothetical protein
MFLSFILLVLLAFIPFPAAFFALDITLQVTQRFLPHVLLFFAGAATAKLFTVSLVLPEVQGHNVQTFIIQLVIQSMEFVFFRLALSRAKIRSQGDKATGIAFWWACVSAFATATFPLISNSRAEELEIDHIVSAMSVLYFLFLAFAMKNLALSLSINERITGLSGKGQFLLLLLGLPNAIGSLDLAPMVPSFVPDLVKVLTSALIWAVIRVPASAQGQ